MPRFAITKYSPVKDSSEGYRTVDPSRVILHIPTRDGDGRLGCLCGCGYEPFGEKSQFMMGHDARLRGKLIRAHLTGTEVVRIIGQEQKPGVPAWVIADELGWTDYLEAADLRREGKNRQVLQTALNSERLIKVGRWEYTGQVVAIYGENGGQEYDIEYVTKLGDVKRVRVPADAAKEVAS